MVEDDEVLGIGNWAMDFEKRERVSQGIGTIFKTIEDWEAYYDRDWYDYIADIL